VLFPPCQRLAGLTGDAFVSIHLHATREDNAQHIRSNTDLDNTASAGLT